MIRLAIILLLSAASFISLRGVGSAEEIPSWFVSVKTSEKPLGNFTSSGVWLSESLVMTCYHSVRDYKEGRDKLWVEDWRGVKYHNVKVLKTDPGADLALLKVVAGLGHQGDVMVVSSEVEYGGGITAVGWNKSVTKVLTTKGVTTGVTWLGGRGRKVGFTHDARVEQGMSGGPAIGEDGQLVGVNVSTDGRTSYAVNLPTIHSILNQVE